MGTQEDKITEEDEEIPDKSGGSEMPSMVEAEAPQAKQEPQVPSPVINPVLANLLQEHIERLPLGMEEVGYRETASGHGGGGL